MVVPFFFLSIGLNFEIEDLFLNPLVFFVILITATPGKIVGTMATKPFTNLKNRQLYLIGWGMNSRGAVELVIASIALPLLPIEVFSSIVAMAIITTLVFPLILRYEIKKYPDIMD